ncbi:MAG: hypothetical protein J7498_13310 [Sphingobium sp.]|nr:hypothetical protein [Sphingobium sp.]
MDIHEMNDRYGISMKKLRRMYQDGILKIGKSATPKYWQMVISDIRKGKMSARSIALAYRSPKQLEELARLTPRDRNILREHFKLAGLPHTNLDLEDHSFLAPCGAAENNPRYLADFIEGLKKVIPAQNVFYEFVAVRWLLLKCNQDVDIYNTADFLPKALFYARADPSFKEWWHKEPHLYGKYRIVYHRPQSRYDL